MSQLNFDATTVAPSEFMEAIPAGWYNVQIDQSEMKPTRDGSGAYLEIRFSILDGQYVNRKVFSRLNLRNSNPVAQEIAYGQLSSICRATGVLQVQDSQQLHGHPLKIKVSVRAATGEYEASNEVKAFKNINEAVGASAPAPVQNAAPWGTSPQTASPIQAQQFTPPNQAPSPVAPAPQWQPPAVPQPWAQAPQPQPEPQPVQQPPAAPQPPQGATPPWMQQATAPAGGVPPWAAPQS